jgi:hypothetical protein
MHRRIPLLIFGLAFVAAACAPVSMRTVPYSGQPQQAGTDSTRVLILLAEPQVPNIKLGEIFVNAPGDVSRERLEANVKSGAANLGADAAWIVRDDTRLFPIVYVDPWWGPVGRGTGSERQIIAVAIKFR